MIVFYIIRRSPAVAEKETIALRSFNHMEVTVAFIRQWRPTTQLNKPNGQKTDTLNYKCEKTIESD